MTQAVDETHQPVAIEKGSLFQRVRSEWKTLAQLGTPILIAQLAQMANGVIDTLMAGRASADDLTGVAIGNSLWIPIFLFVLGVLNAQQPLISGFKGAKQYHRIMPIAWHGIYFALFAAAVAILIFNNLDPLLIKLQLDTTPARITSGYLFAFSWGIPALLLIISLRGLTDGLGHTRIIMVFTLISVTINTPLNYIFIFGKLGMPAMGGVGCGWATAISNWIGLIGLLVYLHRAAAFKQFRLWSHRIRLQKSHMLELLRLGIPIGFTIFVEAIMFSVIALLLAPLGSIIIAGHQIALNIVSVLFMVPLSLGMALTLRISFLIGADQPECARLVARSSIIFALTIALSFALLLMINRELIVGFYSTETDVLDVAVQLLWFGALFQIADVLQVNFISALRGFKDTKIPMIIMLLSFWVIGVPLGYILTFTDRLLPAMGAAGFWIGLIAGLSHAAFWLFIRLIWISRKDHNSLPLDIDKMKPDQI
ncbi:MAG: MATE family efflux transporter [Gammaproteobacteria bacterium]|jgi:MATE family multidrug resistance protein|nr:MATE family efflux transporter [Gammaproteobacteria bacterium]MBT3725473.1 MATE family efflux transporter [Gammaproteobacteria bacterium]MBT4195586.1 MATE family efflux transporter [Gammaproteobacteria bacterium]MBT4448670.1 MATE family efflux transporter [Gammaproteobacteria bacterium]MBT4862387.1 MATE family efflux transporter [Gammaproteobacteria bacterium]